MVRRESAKLLYMGSIPIQASKYKRIYLKERKFMSEEIGVPYSSEQIAAMEGRVTQAQKDANAAMEAEYQRMKKCGIKHCI